MNNNIKFQVAEEIYLEKNNFTTTPMYPLYEKLFEIDSSDDLKAKLADYYDDDSLTIKECEDPEGLVFLCLANNENHYIKVIESDLYDHFVDKIH